MKIRALFAYLGQTCWWKNTRIFHFQILCVQCRYGFSWKTISLHFVLYTKTILKLLQYIFRRKFSNRLILEIFTEAFNISASVGFPLFVTSEQHFYKYLKLPNFFNIYVFVNKNWETLNCEKSTLRYCVVLFHRINLYGFISALAKLIANLHNLFKWKISCN